MQRSVVIVCAAGMIACSSPPSGDPIEDGTSTAASSTGAGQSEAESAPGSESTGGTDAGTSSPSGTSDSGTSASDTGLDCSALPDPAPTWLTDYQDEIVGALSGHTEIRPGVVLPERSTVEHRGEAADFLVDRFDMLALEWFLHEYEGGGINVYARLPSTTGNTSAVVLGAHYDTVPGSPGANDNATGVALVLAVARYLIDVPCRDADVVFVLFDEEEIGLVGSWQFAGFLVNNDVDVIAAHTVDQMGWDADGDRAIEIERPDRGLFEIYETAVSLSGLSIPLHQTQTGFTDHVSFREWGLPAVGLTEEFVNGDTTPHYHQSSDTYDTVDLEYLASTTELVNVAFASVLAP